MTIKQWHALDEMEQIEAIWNKGIKVGERKDETYTYNLFQVGGLFIEEQIHTEWKVRRSFAACDPSI